MPTDMKALARLGAKSRILELQQEIDNLYTAFPDLRRSSPGRKRGRPASAGRQQAAAQLKAPPKRNVKTMSADARKAVSDRMKKYWAARRKEEKK